MSDLAPIVLFVYNRPDHTRRTLAALAADLIAKDADLIVYADGPKKPEHLESVAATRAAVRGARGFKSINLIERDENRGLANSIISGLNEVCAERGRAIVIEDDLVISPEFLGYMNCALDRYKDDDRVMQISGYMFPVNKPDDLPDAFFSRLPTSWGWATWQRAWGAFEPDAKVLLERIRPEDRTSFDLGGAYPYFQMLEQQSRGTLDVWGVRWYASMFLRGGLCLYPSHSLVNNIGMDGSGEHCGPSTAYDVDLGNAAPNVLPAEIEISAIGEAKIREFFLELKGSFLDRFIVLSKQYLLSLSRRKSRANA